jgi:hypothetical protein
MDSKIHGDAGYPERRLKPLIHSFHGEGEALAEAETGQPFSEYILAASPV